MIAAAEPNDRSAPLLAMRGIRKRFPGVEALTDVDLEVRRGEVHALVGENGAGKSTLMHVLAGVHQPEAGRIELDGREDVVIADEHAAQALGIAIVFQERSLFGPLSVAENIFAGRQPVRGWGHIDRRALLGSARRLLAEVGLRLDPRTRVEELSPAEQQLVEIAKALSLDARLLIFDEPTAALTGGESSTLFAVIDRLRRQGAGVIYISHRLEEIFEIADRVTVLKDGRRQGTFSVAATSPRELVSRMVGRDGAPSDLARDPVPATSPVVLEVRGLRDVGREGVGGRTRLWDVSLRARAGEIVVLAGLAGAGRTETALAVFGLRPGASGEVLVGGRPAWIRCPADAIAAGIGYLPEDRKEAGLFLDMSVAANVAAAGLERFGGWWLDDRGRDRTAEEYCRTLHVGSRGVGQRVLDLSGGNQQKVLLAKWLLVDPRVLIVDEPTRGVDVGAKAEVHGLLYELSRRGAAVIVISSDLPEVLAVADRIVVLREGRVTGELDRAAATEEAVMRLASMEGSGDRNARAG